MKEKRKIEELLEEARGFSGWLRDLKKNKEGQDAQLKDVALAHIRQLRLILCLSLEDVR